MQLLKWMSIYIKEIQRAHLEVSPFGTLRFAPLETSKTTSWFSLRSWQAPTPRTHAVAPRSGASRPLLFNVDLRG